MDARQLLVLLANAERAWAYAMEIKGEAQGAPRAVGRHAASRMRRAAAWAAELAKRCVALPCTTSCMWPSGREGLLMLSALLWYCLLECR